MTITPTLDTYLDSFLLGDNRGESWNTVYVIEHKG